MIAVDISKIEHIATLQGMVLMQQREIAELVAILKDAHRYAGLVHSDEIPGDDQIFGFMDDVAKLIQKHGS